MHTVRSALLDLDFLTSGLQPGPWSAATEQLSSQRCKHLSQVIEMLNDGRAVRPAMSRIQPIARSNFAGRHPCALSSSVYISRTTAHCSHWSAGRQLSLQCGTNSSRMRYVRDGANKDRTTQNLRFASEADPTLYSFRPSGNAQTLMPAI